MLVLLTTIFMLRPYRSSNFTDIANDSSERNMRERRHASRVTPLIGLPPLNEVETNNSPCSARLNGASSLEALPPFPALRAERTVTRKFTRPRRASRLTTPFDRLRVSLSSQTNPCHTVVCWTHIDVRSGQARSADGVAMATSTDAGASADYFRLGPQIHRRCHLLPLGRQASCHLMLSLNGTHEIKPENLGLGPSIYLGMHWACHLPH